MKCKSEIVKKCYVNGEPIILAKSFVLKGRGHVVPEIKYSIKGPWGVRPAVFDEDKLNEAYYEYENRIEKLKRDSLTK